MALSSKAQVDLRNALGVYNTWQEVVDILNSVPNGGVLDDVLLNLGDGDDIALVNRSTVLNANTALTGVMIGTPVTPAVAANSLIVSNITASGDILVAANRGGNSEGYLFADSSAGQLYLYAPAAAILLTPTTDTQLADGTGLLVGHTAQVTVSNGDGTTALVPELQVLGTTKTDSSLLLASFNTTNDTTVAPSMNFLKSGNGTIATLSTAVAADEVLGEVNAFGADATDGKSCAARIQFAVDAGVTVGTGDLAGSIRLFVSPDGSETLAEKWRLTSVGVLTSVAGTPANAATADGAVLATGGIAFTDVANAWIDDATQGNGTVTHYIGNNTIDTSAPSDRKLKKNIEPTKVQALPKLLALEMVDFSWRDETADKSRQFGWIAQQVQEVIPELVTQEEGANGILYVKKHNIVTYLVKAMQEMHAEMQELKAKLESR